MASTKNIARLHARDGDEPIDHDRRQLFGAAAALVAPSLPCWVSSAHAQTSPSRSFGPLKRINAGTLNIEYAEVGPADGSVAILLHGWPYDIHAFLDVAPVLAQAGHRVIVPYLRGYGMTRFLSAATPRNGQQSVVAVAGAPVISVPTITLEGDANGAPHPEPAAYAAKFSGKYQHRLITGGIGHNLPQEAPDAFARAVLETVAL